jgi:hypothetical protein
MLIPARNTQQLLVIKTLHYEQGAELLPLKLPGACTTGAELSKVLASRSAVSDAMINHMCYQKHRGDKSAINEASDTPPYCLLPLSPSGTIPDVINDIR